MYELVCSSSCSVFPFYIVLSFLLYFCPQMLKRLSYPLAWMEGFTSEKDEKEVISSVPNSADSQHHSSVFSKVFSRQVFFLLHK